MKKLRIAALLAVLGSLSACADAVVMQDPATPADAEMRGDLKTGWIWRHGADRPLEVRYEERDGLAIWQGDIVIGKAGEVPATREALEARLRQHPGGPSLGLGISPGTGRWPLGRIPYALDPNLAYPQRVLNAIAHIEAQSPGTFVDWVPRYSETDYVYITTAAVNDCASPVGRQGGQQMVYLGSSCSLGNIIHELLHAMGMHHEHVRCDRDSYLSINWANMKDPSEPYYVKACDGFDEYGVYDYGSIMHYGPYADAINTSTRTLTPVPFSSTNLNKMGQRTGMSSRDASTIAQMYPKPNGPTGLAVAYPGNVPTLSWNAVAGASHYSIELTQRYEESDYERGYTSWESGSLVGNTTGTSITDSGNSYTGNAVCNLHYSAYGYSDYYYYYDVYTVYPDGRLSWLSRTPAEVGVC